MGFRACLAALSCLVGFSVTPAAAQLSEGGGPVSYSADSLEYFDSRQELELRGDVDLVQGDARLKADRVTLYFTNTSSSSSDSMGLGAGDISRMVARGEVYYVRPAQSARGDQAIYETSADTVTFSGNVVVASDDNVIRGETLVLRVKERQTTIRPGRGGRVRGVVNTNSSQ